MPSGLQPHVLCALQVRDLLGLHISPISRLYLPYISPISPLQVRDLLGLASTFDGGVAILPKLYCHIDRYGRCLLLRGVRVRVRVGFALP